MKCKPTCVRPGIGANSQHCGICHETFASPSLGDAHRVAAILSDSGRRASYLNRCLPPDEMAALGWHLDQFGKWRRPKREETTKEEN